MSLSKISRIKWGNTKSTTRHLEEKSQYKKIEENVKKKIKIKLYTYEILQKKNTDSNVIDDASKSHFMGVGIFCL